MTGPLERLVQESERLLTAIRNGARGDTLTAHLESRQASLNAFAEAAARGERVSREDARQLRDLDEGILRAVRQRRDTLIRELHSFYQRRSLQRAYLSLQTAPAQFMDRAV